MPAIGQRPIQFAPTGGPHGLQLQLTNQGPATAYYGAAPTVGTGDTALAVNSSVTISAPTWFICAPGTSTTLATADLPLGSTQTGSVVVAASGDTTGASDTALLQSALDAAATAGGGTVKGVSGKTYTLRKQSAGAPYGLSIPSKTTLDMTGCTVGLFAGSDCPLLVNSGHAALLAGGSWVAPSDVRVIGGIWDKGTNGGTGNGLHTMILGGSGLLARDLHFKSTSGSKYALLIQNATDWTVENVFCDNTVSDGVHIQGPAARGVLRNVHGQTHDDLVAVTPKDYPAYVWGNEGDVTDLEIDGVFTNQGGSRALIILSGNGLNTKRITARNITGALNSTQPGIIVGDDTSQANTSGGQIDDVTIDGVTVAVNTTSQAVVSLAGNNSSLTIPKVTIRNVDLQGKDLSAAVSVNTKVTALTVDGVTGSTATAPLSGAVVVIATGNAWPSVSRLNLRNVDVTYAGTRGGSLLRASTSGQTMTEVFLSSVYLTNAAWLSDHLTSTTFRCSNVHMASNGGIFNVRSPSATIVSGWSGCTADTTSSTITSTGTVQSLAQDFPLDISGAQVARNNGDRCTCRVTNGLVVAGSTCEFNTAGGHWYDGRGQASTI